MHNDAETRLHPVDLRDRVDATRISSFPPPPTCAQCPPPMHHRHDVGQTGIAHHLRASNSALNRHKARPKCASIARTLVVAMIRQKTLPTRHSGDRIRAAEARRSEPSARVGRAHRTRDAGRRLTGAGTRPHPLCPRRRVRTSRRRAVYLQQTGGPPCPAPPTTAAPGKAAVATTRMGTTATRVGATSPAPGAKHGGRLK